jgi:putative Ca2+/H+ antiporter (TMEM165/GDT1 family)
MTAPGVALATWAASPLLYVVFVAYGTILTAELVGDKSLYTVTSLVTRFPLAVVAGAMAVAFAGKMCAAVLLGTLIVRIPASWASIVSAAALFASGVFIWRDEPGSMAAAPREARSLRAGIICFTSLFVPEWGDPGQLAAAALTVQARSPIGPWIGGTLALVTKGTLAVALGLKLRDHLPRRRLRIFASVACCALGVATLGRWLVGP